MTGASPTNKTNRSAARVAADRVGQLAGGRGRFDDADVDTLSASILDPFPQRRAKRCGTDDQGGCPG